MIDQGEEDQSFGEKLVTLIGNHRRFITEFQKSLRNSRHFIKLADRSMETEPENTVSMLRQIREIDLLGHVQRLAEEFNGVRGFLTASPMEEEAETHRVELAELADEYEDLEQEAADQQQRIDRLLSFLRS